MLNIWVIATLDTKFTEAKFIAERISASGNMPILIDPGSAGNPGIIASFTREMVALSGGEDLDSLKKKNDKTHSQQIMREGLVNIISSEFTKGNLDAVIAVGGGQGTAIATAAMRVLPFGIPKVMFSTVDC